MRASFDQKLVAASCLLIFCSISAGIVGAANVPNAVARSAITDVNRVDKGDQLTTAPIRQAQQRLLPPAEDAKASLQRPPLGCDPAFSPVAEPLRAGIYRRCTV